MGTAHTAVLREADAAVRNELTGFDLSHCGFNQPTVLPSLLFGNHRPEVLNLRLILANEHHHGYIRNSAHPGVANQLWVKRQESLGLFGITACGGLPVDDAGCSIELSKRVNVGNEFVPSGKRSKHLDLQILLRPGNVNPIILGELLEQ